MEVNENHRKLVRMLRSVHNTGRGDVRAFLYNKDFAAQLVADFERDIRAEYIKPKNEPLEG